MSTGREPLIDARAVGRPPIEIRNAGRVFARRSEDDLPPVRRPQLSVVAARIERQARQLLACEIPRPNVRTLLENLERYTLSVRRETSHHIPAWRRRNR